MGEQSNTVSTTQEKTRKFYKFFELFYNDYVVIIFSTINAQTK